MKFNILIIFSKKFLSESLFFLFSYILKKSLFSTSMNWKDILIDVIKIQISIFFSSLQNNIIINSIFKFSNLQYN